MPACAANLAPSAPAVNRATFVRSATGDVVKEATPVELAATLGARALSTPDGKIEQIGCTGLISPTTSLGCQHVAGLTEGFGATGIKGCNQRNRAVSRSQSNRSLRGGSR